MSRQISHWFQAGLAFVLTILAGGILLPLVRRYPESVHAYFNDLGDPDSLEINDLVRIGFAFCLCVVFTHVLFKLLSPRVGQLSHWATHPPAWLAVFVATGLVASVDLLGGFDPNGYRADVWEWLGYGGGALLVVAWYSGLGAELFWRLQKPMELETHAPKCITLQDIANAPWEEIEAWLESDAPAQYDFLGNQSVAHRVSLLISKGTRSIGIVGPFGSGKTSIVSWVKDRLNSHRVGSQKYFICHHSCWGFETSYSAIREMLESAVSQLGAEVDTFQVDSLPESYRKAFSSGGNWMESISNVMLRNPDPMDQFANLSDLLGAIGGRLVFIVEDLDRNETRNFEIQEVLAFLERLKKFENFSFILTGGLTSTRRIDYAKLCDNIELLEMIDKYHSSGLIDRVSGYCLDDAIFPHVRLADPNRNYEWNPLTGLLLRDHEEFSTPHSVALLLNTPRSLRHALARTFSAWQTLHGEIDFNDLLAVNILRFGAPECFQFLWRQRDRLGSAPAQNSSDLPSRVEGIRQAVLDDWIRTIENVEWNPTAAIKVMQFLLSDTEYWLKSSEHSGYSKGGLQRIFEDRYWRRAINEAIDATDVRDQEVIRDIQEWQKSPDSATALTTGLTSSSQYGDVWESLAGGFFANQPDLILLLCEQVIQRILEEHGASSYDDSPGFIHAWRFANRRVPRQLENRIWLQNRISEAACVSIRMVYDLWYFFGQSSSYSILRFEDLEVVRQRTLDAVKALITDGHSIVSRLHPRASSTLYMLVFDSGNHSEEKFLTDPESWSWLGHPILEALRDKNPLAAANCGVLLGARVSADSQTAVDSEVLDSFFGQDASEVIDLLETMIDQIPEKDQPLVRNVIGAARTYLVERADGTMDTGAVE
ncbi:MAG: P-loop NTPase fold protein [Pirellulaceae bacterium]